MGADWSGKSPTNTNIFQVKDYVFMSLWPVLSVAPLLFRIFFRGNMKSDFKLLFFFKQNKGLQKGQVSLTSKRNIFLDLDLKIVP